MAFDTKNFIEEARKKGVPDQQIFTYLNSKNLIPKESIVASTPPKKERGFVADAFNTLLVKPAARFAEAVGRTGILGQTIKTGYEEQIGQDQEIKLPGASRSLGTVEAQKSFGQGGGTQIFSDALKSASYLLPYGKVASGASTIARTLGASSNLSRVVGGVAAGATGGYTVDVSQNLDKSGEITANAFTPGFATLMGGFTGGVLEGAGIAVEKLSRSAKNFGKELEEQSFRLTDNQRAKLGSKLDELTKFSSENIPAGDPSKRLTYADDLVDKYENDLQFFLKTVAKENRSSTSIPKATFLRQLRAIKGKYRLDRDAQAITKQIDSAINTIKNQYKGDYIPVDKLNIFKRSTYKNAFNKAGDKVADYIEYDIGDAARVAIERAVKGGEIGNKSLGVFNREYGNLLQLRKLLKVAEGRPELGFTKRITSRIIGGLIGYSLGGIPGVIGGELLADPVATALAGTSAKTSVARRLLNIKPRNVGSVIQRLRP